MPKYGSHTEYVEALHRDEVDNGPFFKCKRDDVTKLTTVEGGRTYVIKVDRHSHRLIKQAASQVAGIANRDEQYDLPAYDETACLNDFYAVIRDGRCIALLVTIKVPNLKWRLYRAWTAPNMRRKGWMAFLLNEILQDKNTHPQRMMVLEPHLMTSAGRAFLQKFIERDGQGGPSHLSVKSDHPSWYKLPISGTIWQDPLVKIKRRPPYAVVEYDLGSCPELSKTAFDALSEYMNSYHKVHRRQLRIGRVDIWPVWGKIRVVPEHSREFAVRILVFVANPANHDRAETLDFLRRPSRQVEKLRKLYEKSLAKQEDNYERVKSEFPDYVDDPFGELPSTDGKPSQPRTVVCNNA